MPVANDEIVQVTARVEFGGVDDMVNVFQFINASGLAVPDSEAITDLAAFMDSLYTTIALFQPTTVLYRDLRMVNLDTGDILGIVPWPGLSTGLHVGQPMAPGVAAVVNFYGDEPRRVMRKYIGGLVEDSSDADGVLNAITVTELGVFAAELLAPIVGTFSTWLYCYDNFLPLSNLMIPTSAVATNIPGYQRRRKQGRGS